MKPRVITPKQFEQLRLRLAALAASKAMEKKPAIAALRTAMKQQVRRRA